MIGNVDIQYNEITNNINILMKIMKATMSKFNNTRITFFGLIKIYVYK